MASRYAGDYFGISLGNSGGASSVLLDYYPELRSPAKSTGATPTGARSVGGTEAAKVFTGFKTFPEKQGPKAAAPVFTGFKTIEKAKQ
jgi:hypothetical protein